MYSVEYGICFDSVESQSSLANPRNLSLCSDNAIESD